MHFWPFSYIKKLITSQQGCIEVYEKSLVCMELPKPNKTGGMSLSEALCKRRSIRNFSNVRISNQQLSDLLWSACGINGERKGGDGSCYLHTNPTACNHQEVKVYVFMQEGAYLYDSIKNCLLQIKREDCRHKLSEIDFVQNAPISLCLVSDTRKMFRFDDRFRRDMYAPMDIGYVSENIYLHCAANNLATCACGLINRVIIAKLLGLNKCKVFLVHPLGEQNKQ